MTTQNKTILLAVTGATPQVVTETLYGIYQQGLEWPDEIVIITTSFGKNQAYLQLIAEGKLKALCDEYQLPLPHFTEQLIKVIPDANGQEVADARTPEDQEALADFIVKQVAELTKDEQCRIHASIAGGRKTMTFFLGYAMSIFAREHDRLSHVLVSEQFESNPQFYFPTKDVKTINGRDNITLDCSKAEVMLAEIPLISQRMINPEMVEEFSNFSYNDIVSAIQLMNRPQKLTLELCYDKHNPRVIFGNKEISFAGRKADFGMLAAFARARSNNEPGFYRQSTANHPCFTKAMLKELCLLEGKAFNANDLADTLDDLEMHKALDGKTVAALKRGKTIEFDVGNFSDRRNSLKTLLNRALPKAAVNLLLPQTHGKNNPYKINIPAQNITFTQA